MLFSLERQMDSNHSHQPPNGAYNYWRDMGVDEVIEDLIALNEVVST